ncbi:MAG: SCP2 sterol-binding domain-containing protein [Acidimicrobiales bacterium]
MAVPRFLSPAWFSRLEELAGSGLAGSGVAASGRAGGQASEGSAGAGLVLEQVVTATPEGEIRYHVLLAGGSALIRPGAPERADLTFTNDYPTASALVRGELSTQSALADGRIRVRGDLRRLADAGGTGAGLDPLPATLRAETTF